MRGATSRQRRRFIVIPAVLAIGASTLTTPAAAAHEAAAAAKPANVKVVDLRVNGRYDDPLLGLGDPTPILSWRMKATPSARSHPLPAGRARRWRARPTSRPPTRSRPPNSVRALNQGNLIWDSGKVAGSDQSGVPYAGRRARARASRSSGASASGTPTARPPAGASPARGRWGCSSRATGATPAGSTTPVAPRASRCRSSPASSMSTSAGWPRRGCTSRALGVHEATVNGEELTDEVLAPGYSNFQLSAEYRTYDVTDELVGGSNTVGVQLGNWHGVRPAQRDQPRRRAHGPYSWWQSQLKGSGTLHEDAPAGATNVMPSSTANYHLGGTINVDTGDGGDRLESRVITNIGTAPTTVAAPNVIGGTPAAVTDRRQLDLERRRRQHEHAGRPDRRPQDVRGGGSGGAGDRRAPRERRRRPHHLRQRHPGLGLRRWRTTRGRRRRSPTSSRCSWRART